MDYLNKMVEIKTDEQILAVYKEVLSLGKVEHAELLRAKFIRSRALRPAVEWTPALREMFDEEIENIYKMFHAKTEISETERWKLNGEDSRLSRIAGFMLMNLVKNGAVDSSVSQKAFELSHKEIYLLSGNMLEVFVTDLFLSEYLEDDKLIKEGFNRFLRHMMNKFPRIKRFVKGLKSYDDIEESNSIAIIQDTLTNYNDDPDAFPYSKEVFAYVLMIAHFGCVKKKDVTSAKYFLIKSMDFLHPEDFLRDILVFVEKEID